MTAPVPVVVLGGSGYVAGELLRLLAQHPDLLPFAAISESRAGEAVEDAFPHLRGALRGLRFRPAAQLADAVRGAGQRVAIASAAPHGASAPLLDAALAAAEEAGATAHAVDLSADFRFPTPGGWEAVYGHPHPRPGRIAEFHCAVPELAPAPPAIDGLHAAHPGCFTTAVVLAAAPLLALGLIEPWVHVTAVTGSTGSGRTPGPTTHHPERHANLVAYQPLVHRHEAEMRRLLGRASGGEVEVLFVPHSGPFARGIHATLHARLRGPRPAAEIAARIAEFYAGAPFLEVRPEPPRLRDVVGTNRCLLGVATRDDALVAFSALDNLVKGAAGGAVQWMNRQWGFEETSGLVQPGLGWI